MAAGIELSSIRAGCFRRPKRPPAHHDLIGTQGDYCSGALCPVWDDYTKLGAMGTAKFYDFFCDGAIATRTVYDQVQFVNLAN